MYTYLALGDSYTIGELVPLQDNFPYRLAETLNLSGTSTAEPVIIATTGWTTDELLAAISERNIQETFSFVTLLIGVNNQYRGRSIANYQEEFATLLKLAINFAKGRPSNVFVLSIPDWGVTPFAKEKDQSIIAKEIDAYNAACRTIAEAEVCPYLDITESTRRNGAKDGFLAEDGLHPSGKEYLIWAKLLAPMVAKSLP